MLSEKFGKLFFCLLSTLNNVFGNLLLDFSQKSPDLFCEFLQHMLLIFCNSMVRFKVVISISPLKVELTFSAGLIVYTNLDINKSCFNIYTDESAQNILIIGLEVCSTL